MAVQEVRIESGWQPGAIGRITEMHARSYSREDGFGPVFEAKVAEGLASFIPRLDHPRNGLWCALRGERIVGSIAMDGQDQYDGAAHLRYFIVDDTMRGSGLGRRLLRGALDFADAQGFPRSPGHAWRGARCGHRRLVGSPRRRPTADPTAADRQAAPTRSCVPIAAPSRLPSRVRLPHGCVAPAQAPFVPISRLVSIGWRRDVLARYRPLEPGPAAFAESLPTFSRTVKLVSMTRNASTTPDSASQPRAEFAVSPRPSRRWPLQDAKARFSELVRQANQDGPQHVTVHGREVVVVDASEFSRLTGDATGQLLIDALQASPHKTIDIQPARAPMPMPVRDVEL